MPPVTVVFYKDDDGSVPVRQWLQELESRDLRAAEKCAGKLLLLSSMGHEMRRPHAENLGQGIYELRIKVGRVNYRILYFFHGWDACVLAHGFAKEKEIPQVEIDRALRRKARYEEDSDAHREESW